MAAHKPLSVDLRITEMRRSGHPRDSTVFLRTLDRVSLECVWASLGTDVVMQPPDESIFLAQSRIAAESLRMDSGGQKSDAPALPSGDEAKAGDRSDAEGARAPEIGRPIRSENIGFPEWLEKLQTRIARCLDVWADVDEKAWQVQVTVRPELMPDTRLTIRYFQGTPLWVQAACGQPVWRERLLAHRDDLAHALQKPKWPGVDVEITSQVESAPLKNYHFFR
jgi:Type III secretion protein (HpaP)